MYTPASNGTLHIIYMSFAWKVPRGIWRCVNARDTRADIVGRHCWLVCRGSRRCRLTNLTFNFYLLVVFCCFLRKAVAFCREISYICRWANVIDFSCAIFASKHVSAMISKQKHRPISISITATVTRTFLMRRLQ